MQNKPKKSSFYTCNKPFFSYFRNAPLVTVCCVYCLHFFTNRKRLKQQGDHNTEKPTKENSSNGSSVALKTPLQTAEYRRRRSVAAAASAPSDDFGYCRCTDSSEPLLLRL